MKLFHILLYLTIKYHQISKEKLSDESDVLPSNIIKYLKKTSDESDVCYH